MRSFEFLFDEWFASFDKRPTELNLFICFGGRHPLPGGSGGVLTLFYGIYPGKNLLII